MGVGAGLYMYDVVAKSSHSLSHLLMSSCTNGRRKTTFALTLILMATGHWPWPWGLSLTYTANRVTFVTCNDDKFAFHLQNQKAFLSMVTLHLEIRASTPMKFPWGLQNFSEFSKLSPWILCETGHILKMLRLRFHCSQRHYSSVQMELDWS